MTSWWRLFGHVIEQNKMPISYGPYTMTISYGPYYMTIGYFPWSYEELMIDHYHQNFSISAIFDLNNDEKKEPNISRASWLATIKVYFRECSYCMKHVILYEQYRKSKFSQTCWMQRKYIAIFNGKNMLLSLHAYTCILCTIYCMQHTVYLCEIMSKIN